MQAWVEGIDVAVWDAIEEGPYIPMHTVDGKVVEKPRKEWSLEEKRLAQFGVRAKTIIISALGNDEFPRISNYKTAKEMWDVLKVTHEGTDEVKRSKINALTREFEMFQMNPGENIQDMQKRSTYLINQLHALGKDYSNEDLINKVLRCLSRDW